MLKLLQTSSLEKVLPQTTCPAAEITGLSALRGETVFYQVAYCANEPKEYTVSVQSAVAEHVRLYAVRCVPVYLATFSFAMDDPNYISHNGGLYPDHLQPLVQPTVKAYSGYEALWVELSGDLPAGDHTVTLVFSAADGERQETTFCLHTIDAALPPQELQYTQWFHTDCISTYYGVEAFSEEHWVLIEKFIRMAAENGVNMLLTPIFTPPLDTAVGGERPTVQLVGISRRNGQYTFDFTALRRWIALGERCGIRYFEMAHLFTQWGAEYTPKIMVEEEGVLHRAFGWDVAATDPRYEAFLDAFLPALTAELRAAGVAERTVFHISDEPEEGHLESYTAAKRLAEKHLQGFRMMDALSSYAFYSRGLVAHPVVATTAIGTFIEHDVRPLWAYYCCGQVAGCSNRLMAMPSWRTRFIAYPLFKFAAEGFLQWGYNFYYTQFSTRPVDPFTETDAGHAFPAGDAFSVYPGPQGPEPSLRLFVFREALQDLRAMRLLEGMMGHEALVKLLEEIAGGTITFGHCAQEAATVLAMRARVNAEIEKRL